MKVLPFLLLLVSFLFVQGQNKHYADSLKSLIQTNPNISDSLYNELLLDIIQFTSNPTEVFYYSELLLDNSGLTQTQKIVTYQNLAVAHRMQGNLEASLENLLISAEMADKEGEADLLAEAYLEIGTTYTSNEDYDNAIIYFNKAIKVFRKLDDDQSLAINLLNTGYTYYLISQYDTALLYYDEAGHLFDSLAFPIGQAYTLGNRALIYWKAGDPDRAESDLLQAITMLEPLGDDYGIADYHNQLGNLYLEQSRKEKARHHLKTGLDIALELDLKEQIRDASRLLARLSASIAQYEKAYAYHQQYAAYQDSIQNQETTRQMANQRTEYEVNLREKEIDLLEQDKYLQRIYILIAVVLLLFFIALFILSRQHLRAQRLQARVAMDAHNQQVTNLLDAREKNALESMIRGRDEERKHLAHELHNHLGNMLAAIKVNLNGLQTENQKVNKLHELVDQVYTDVRELSHTLNMGVYEGFGLVPALQELANHLSESGKIAVEFHAVMDDCHISFESEIVIYRVVQELTSNVLKHAQANTMGIMLTCFRDDEIINIIVSDDGVGFDQTTEKEDGIGLASLSSMIRSLRGDVEVDSQPGKGTTINIDLPLPKNNLENNL